MTGIIITNPPAVELPPGNNNNNPASLPGVTHQAALLGFPQTWTAAQTYRPDTFLLAGSSIGALTLNAPATASGTITFPPGDTDFSATGGTSKVVKQTTLGGPFTVGQLSYLDISGTVTVPPPSPTTLGGVKSLANVSHKWINSIGTDGTPTQTQPDSSDVTFTPAGAGAVTRTMQDKIRDSVSVSVTDFTGVDPTGATNSTAGLQVAFNSGAAVVNVPAGTFISTRLALPSNIRITGPGTIKRINSDVAIGALLDLGSSTNVTIDGITIDGNRANQTNPCFGLIGGNGCAKVNIRKCVLHDNKTGDCISILNGADQAGSTQTTIENNMINSNDGAGISVSKGWNISILDNRRI
jgi:parallel beta-helix repeat protein